MKWFLSFVAATIAVVPAFAQQPQTSPQPPAPKTVYIRAGHLFDGTGDKTRENMVIVVVGERIQSVAPAGSVTIPAGATVVGLSHATVLPRIDRLPHASGRARRPL